MFKHHSAHGAMQSSTGSKTCLPDHEICSVCKITDVQMVYLNGFPEVARVCGVLKRVCADKHHVQCDTT